MKLIEGRDRAFLRLGSTQRVHMCYHILSHSTHGEVCKDQSDPFFIDEENVETLIFVRPGG